MQTINDFLKNKSFIPFSQFIATPAFPKLYVLVTLSSKAYRDHKEQETGAHYEIRIALPSENLYLSLEEYSLRNL